MTQQEKIDLVTNRIIKEYNKHKGLGIEVVARIAAGKITASLEQEKTEILTQIDEWIDWNQSQEDLFSEKGRLIEALSARSMTVAYNNVRSYIESKEVTE